MAPEADQRLFEQWCEVKIYPVVFDCSTQALQYSET